MKLKKTLISASVGVVALAGVVGLVPDTMSNAEIAAVELHAQEIFGGNAEAVKQMIFDEMKPAKVKLKGKNWELTGENFKSTLKENAVDGWEYEENGKTLGFKSKGMAWDGAKVKTKAAKVKGKIRKNEVDYEDALGAGVDIKIVQGNNKFQKIIEIESLASLGEIPEGAEFLEFSFKLSGDFDLPEGRITDRIPFGENSFVNPIRAWDSSEPVEDEERVESGAFGEIQNGILTKKIPVAWLQQATFPVKTDATITFGSESVFEEASTSNVSATFDSTNEKVVIAYRDGGNSYYGTAVVGTVSGTSISFGTPVVFESAISSDTSATYDANSQKVVIAYRDSGNFGYGTAVVGTVSGTSISFGTPVVLNSASSRDTSATYDANSQKVVIAYKDDGGDDYGETVVGTVSGTGISFTAPDIFESAVTNYISTTYDSTNKKIVIAYNDGGNSSYGTGIVGTVAAAAAGNTGSFFQFFD